MAVTTSYVIESTYGTTPSSPTMREAPVLSHNLNPTPTFIRSRTRRADGLRAAGRQGRVNIGGTLEFELNLDRNMVGGSQAGNLGMLGAFLGGASWVTSTLQTSPQEYFMGLADTNYGLSIERRRGTHPTDAERNQQFKGVHLNQLDLEIVPDALVTGRFSPLGATHSGKVANASRWDATPVAVQGKSPLSAVDAALYVWSASAWTEITDVTQLRLTINRNRTFTGVVGSKNNRGPFDAAISVEGELQVFPEQTTYSFWTDFANETSHEMRLRLNDVNGTEWLEFEIPAVNPITYNEDPPVEGVESVQIQIEANPGSVRTTSGEGGGQVTSSILFRRNLNESDA